MRFTVKSIILRSIILILCISLLLLVYCDSDTNTEGCTKICADKYGECEQACKLQYTIGSADYVNCKSGCEDKYNACIFDCY